MASEVSLALNQFSIKQSNWVVLLPQAPFSRKVLFLKSFSQELKVGILRSALNLNGKWSQREALISL
jgi:hypothetical protein